MAPLVHDVCKNIKRRPFRIQILPQLSPTTMMEIERILDNKPQRPPIVSTLALRGQAQAGATPRLDRFDTAIITVTIHFFVGVVFDLVISMFAVRKMQHWNPEKQLPTPPPRSTSRMPFVSSSDCCGAAVETPLRKNPQKKNQK